MATTPKRRSRNGEDFKPSVSHPCRNTEVKACSVYTQRHLARLYPRAQNSAYQIICMLPVFTTREETAECAEILDKLLNDSTVALREMVAQCEEQFEAAALSGSGQVSYTDAVDVQVPVYTPQAGQFLGLLTTYDRLMQLIDTLWFDRVFTREQRDEALRRANDLLTTTVKKMAQLQTRVIAARERFRLAKKEKDARGRQKTAGANDDVTDSPEAKDAPTSEPKGTRKEGAGKTESNANNGETKPAADDGDSVVDIPARPHVSLMTDEKGVPRVIDSEEGELPGEHLEDDQADAAAAEVDAVTKAVAAAGTDRKSSVKKTTARKSAAA